MTPSTLTAYWTFAVAAGILVITPGLDTALVLRTAATDGARRAFAVACGCCCGVIVWGGAVALGLGALFEVSHSAYTALRWIGAAYLCYIGLGMLIRPRAYSQPTSTSGNEASTGMLSFRRGLLTNLLNPKVGVFYATFLPQFVPSGVNVKWFMLSLSLIHAAEGTTWFLAVLTVARPLITRLQKPAASRALDRTTGAILISFGAKLAMSER